MTKTELPGKILIVDDDGFSRNITASRMRRLGALVAQAADGAAALQELGCDHFSLIILDLDMPKLNGFDLLGCVRGHPRLRHLPVLVLTGCDDRTSFEKALAAGATSVLVKPLNWSAFGPHIEHLIELSAGQPVMPPLRPQEIVKNCDLAEQIN